ncbi:hypothetical protein P7K49_023830, partial [Saguinus oedipus]
EARPAQEGQDEIMQRASMERGFVRRAGSEPAVVQEHSAQEASIGSHCSSSCQAGGSTRPWTPSPQLFVLAKPLASERAHRSTCAGGILLLTRPPPSSVQKVTCPARHPDAPLILPRLGLSMAPPPPSMPALGDLAGSAEMSASLAAGNTTPTGNVGAKHQAVAMSRSPRTFCLPQLPSLLEESYVASAEPCKQPVAIEIIEQGMPKPRPQRRRGPTPSPSKAGPESRGQSACLLPSRSLPVSLRQAS